MFFLGMCLFLRGLVVIIIVSTFDNELSKPSSNVLIYSPQNIIESPNFDTGPLKNVYPVFLKNRQEMLPK